MVSTLCGCGKPTATAAPVGRDGLFPGLLASENPSGSFRVPLLSGARFSGAD